ncbi:DUF4402 domain-containing protein [Sphingomonas sp. HDW15A]|uniref:DUF4402 domain-containing protein n=1 Tax=Sphingomonas sp. HDW15A TaxID=2714942 RepID=UPI00140D30FC|nr:DUF4402 domain-containing protein [Sphingomonas sp. HDW15A]QIK96932.1 DUF4402 domain-containing protein [Sphingomonas sp. HDW15A]
MDIRTAFGAAVAAAAICCAPASAADGSPATETGDSKVIILNPLSFITIEELDFGSVIVPASGNGTVTIDPITGSPSYSNIDYVAGISNAPQRGRFIGSGSANQVIYVTTTLPTFLEKSPGGPSVPVNLKLDRNPNSLGAYVYVVDPLWLTFEIGIGGTLTVPQGTEPGNYSATFDVTATYQ